ncbi:MAG: DUF1343 domain-containing protein [Saprospiraceae bacterium]|nr:DUF1343 domain-containing protein [Saprospiraceae bacterium]
MTITNKYCFFYSFLLTLLMISSLYCSHKITALSSNNIEKDSNYLQNRLPILPGAYQIPEYLPLLINKRIALVANHTSLIENNHLLDTLLQLKIDVVKLFVPEHGLRGEVSAGATILDSKDEKTGIPIVSLYGKTKKPTSAQLQGIDIILFDLQDVGVRFFTYISTLHYIIESASENSKTLVVLDRPNPNGHYVDGPVLDTKYTSFVGMHPIPMVYGLTIGELGKMMIGEKWLKTDSSFQYKLIKCKNYNRSFQYHLPVKPSPNLPNMRAIWLYPGTCLFEGTNWSLGRGTNSPFQIFGHPALPNADTTFIPIELIGAKNPPHKDVLCKGYSCKNINVDSLFNSKLIPLSYILKAYHLRTDSFFLKNNFFDLLAGTDQLRNQIQLGWTEDQIRKNWQSDLEIFRKKSLKYQVY